MTATAQKKDRITEKVEKSAIESAFVFLFVFLS